MCTKRKKTGLLYCLLPPPRNEMLRNNEVFMAKFPYYIKLTINLWKNMQPEGCLVLSVNPVYNVYI